MRPSFSVIVIRLQGIGVSTSKRRKTSFSASEDAAVGALCRGVNELLWEYAPAQWDEEKAKVLVTKDATVTARDPTLNKVLGSEEGPASVKGLGWMMFGGLEDGTEIRQEPVLETDIIVNRKSRCALLKSRFSVIAAAKIKQWGVKDSKKFDGLQVALATSEKSIESWGTGALKKAATGGKATGSGKKKQASRLRLKRKNNSKKDARLANFIKAARFVRGYGAAAIHPSAKLQLHGLRMQAQQGDCKQSAPAAKGNEDSSASSLQRLKRDAWLSLRGKGQEAAMEEYLSLLTSLAPNWKVAHIVLGRESAEARRKPREMMWVLKIGYRKQRATQRLEGGSGTICASNGHNLRGLQVTSIEIVQSSNEANARLWSEDKATVAEAEEGTGDATPSSKATTFIAKLPRDFTLSDCIVDRSLHATMEEQRADFGEQMQTIARGGLNEEEGWEYFGKTVQHRASEEEQLDVYAKRVEWSTTSQLCTRVETTFPMEKVFEHLINNFLKASFEVEDFDDVHAASKVAGDLVEGRTKAHPFLTVAEDRSCLTALFYAETAFPW